MTYRKKTNKNTKKVYTDKKNVGFAAVFTNITRRGALPEEAFIHTTKMTAIKIALKEIYKRKDKKLVIYTDSQRSMKSIKYNKKNHLI